jgi:hypothetical protein
MRTAEEYALKFNWKDIDHLEHTKFIEQIQSEAKAEGRIEGIEQMRNACINDTEFYKSQWGSIRRIAEELIKK